MGLPVDAEINGRYVISQEVAGANSKIVVTRLVDLSKQQLIIKEEWLNFLDGLCPSMINMTVMEMLCDALFV